MNAAGSGQTGPDELESELRRSLYRFDCPDAQTLGEYELDMVGQEQRTRVAAHALDCDACRADLQVLRAFLAEPIRAPESLAERTRRIIATLFAPSPGLAYGGQRGGPDATTRSYRATDVTVTVGPGQTHGSLVGLVISSGRPAEALDGRQVKLLPREGVPTTTALDDLGNFEFADLRPGDYALEIDLPDGVIVIEELRLD